jgi:NAD(P)-dependent dehydrogenase (short-subunit alcohol dehydrogenase family)
MSSEPEHIDESLRGQVAVVTGGSRGIGRALAMRLAQAGAAVAVVARTQSHVAETVADIIRATGKATGVVADVTDRLAVERMVREVEQSLGPVDLLINNAAVVAPLGAIAEVDPEAWWRTQEINVRGPMLCARTVLPGMLTRRRGRIVNMITGAGVMPIANMSAYLMSKVALIRFTELLALEASDRGVRAFAVNPGVVRTDMTEYLMNSAEGRQWTPWVHQQFDSAETPIARSVSTVLAIASGKADVLSGRLVNAREPFEQVLARVREIERDRLYTLRLDPLPGVVAPAWSQPD